MEGSAGKRFVLLASTKAGKSQTANILLNGLNNRPDAAGAAFRVSHKGTSCTTDVSPKYSTLHGWTVVDTPGLGDITLPQRGISRQDSTRQHRVRCDIYMEKITTELRDHGGIPLLLFGEIEVAESKVNHLKALMLVTQQALLTGGAVLVFTNIPQAHLGSPNSSQTEQQAIIEGYWEWVAESKQILCERIKELENVPVLGLAHPDVGDWHPAHPSKFIRVLQRFPTEGLLPGASLVWSHIIKDAVTAQEQREALDKAISTTEKGLAAGKAILELYKEILVTLPPFVVKASVAAPAAAFRWLFPAPDADVDFSDAPDVLIDKMCGPMIIAVEARLHEQRRERDRLAQHGAAASLRVDELRALVYDH